MGALSKHAKYAAADMMNVRCENLAERKIEL